MKPYFTRLWAALRGRDHELEGVRAIQQKFDLINHAVPGHLTQCKLAERFECMMEELVEFSIAADNQNLVDQVDSLVDLVYFAKGTAVMLGIDWPTHWDHVQRANMAKVRGVTKRGHKVDVTKPEGWTPPENDHRRTLRATGYRRANWTWGGLRNGFVKEDQCRDDR